MQIRKKNHCNMNKNTVAQRKEASYAIFLRSMGKLPQDWQLESNSILMPTQSGYRKFISIKDQLVLLLQDLDNCLQEEKKTLTVFFYINHTFDKVWKKGPLLKLLHMGVCYNMYRWICHYESTGSHWIVTLHFKYHLKGTKHCFPKKTTTAHNV